MKLKEFTDKIIEIYGSNLVSLTLYGSAATGEYIEGRSDYNVIIVLTNPAPIELTKARKTILKWVKSGNPLPLFFDEEHIKTSLDVFPIEFFDIKENHKTIYGKDLFDNIVIENKNLRHQCESELKGKILKLQSQFVLNSNHHRFINRLMNESIASFVAIFKGVLRLMGINPYQKRREIIEQLAKYIDFNPAIFQEIMDNKEGKGFFGRQDAIEKFEQYLTELKKITNFVDKYKEQTQEG